LWERVVPPDSRDKILCLNCFDEFATHKGIEWDSEMGTFWPVSGASVLRWNREADASAEKVESEADSYQAELRAARARIAELEAVSRVLRAALAVAEEMRLRVNSGDTWECRQLAALDAALAAGKESK
jgi:hypothetical protein